MSIFNYDFICNTCKNTFKIDPNRTNLYEYYGVYSSDFVSWINDDNFIEDIICLDCLDEDDFIAKKSEKMLKENELNSSIESDDFWSTEIKIVEECSNAPSIVNVYIKPIVQSKINFLMKKFVKLEWLAYFIGENNNENYIINDLFIPEQTATAGNVYNVNNSIPIGTNVVGVIHSHHDMGSFFSGTDNEYINQNHNLSIVVSNSGMKGQARWKTNCGSYKIVDVNVELDYDFDVQSFEKDVDEKINTKERISIKNNNIKSKYFEIDEDNLKDLCILFESEEELYNTLNDSYMTLEDEIKNSNNFNIKNFCAVSK